MMKMHARKGRSDTVFGFEDIMASANVDRFPVWYAERCLLLSPLQGQMRPVAKPRMAEDAFEFTKAAA